ncbi:MAG: prolyl oligopeptidase family serine peptidase [Ferruginibacter sp.]
MKWLLCTLFLLIQPGANAQLGKLTVEKIMRDPKWIGTSPSGLSWDNEGKLWFLWNPEKNLADSFYFVSSTQTSPVKAGMQQKQAFLSFDNIIYSNDRRAYTYSKDGDIFYADLKTGKTRRITQTTDFENNPVFSFEETKIVYQANRNLYAWDITSGETMQLTNIRTEGSRAPQKLNVQEEWLKKDQLAYFEILKQRKQKKDAAEAYNKTARAKELRSIILGEKNLQNLNISPDGRFISYRLSSPGSGKQAIVPEFVTESGFTNDINTRTKVGAPQAATDFFIYDRVQDSIYSISTDTIPGIRDIPAFVKDYPAQYEERKKKNEKRPVFISGPIWSPAGTFAVLDIRSLDNKDRWIMRWNPANNVLEPLDRQHDDAWIGGPGLFSMGWIDEQTFWYQGEASGYSHLYTVSLPSKQKKQLTSGNYEIQKAQLSNDKRSFYVTSNEVHPGEQHFYKLDIASGKKEKLTQMTGAHNVSLSPDEKYIAFLYSYMNKPWELYLQKNTARAKPQQITFKAQSDEFKSYAWKEPELISFPAADGAPVYARVYKPANPHPAKPAVLFVHGAGYLQNAHKWWSNYFREYMFNNLLADEGYYVMDIDYRASAGYGRNWRTGIYRHMGGKDLSDHVDAAKYLVKNFGVSPIRIGIYGGSYGGFISLMALFNEPATFAAGAALRPVTDWANYNHGYTSNILNEPATDSIAYRKSSPFYFAEGLKGHLLICHGMVDVNVHYQDAVKLGQRMIELGKDNWELASYPMEDHGFVEASSWTDEYKRIFKLFENVLKK